MKLTMMVLATLLGTSLLAADTEATPAQERLQTKDKEMIRKDASVDELIKAMNRAKAQERYRYMNAIKAKMKTMSEQQRAEAITTLQQKMEQSKAMQQADMADDAARSQTIEQNKNMIRKRNEMRDQQQQQQQQMQQMQMQQQQQMQGKM